LLEKILAENGPSSHAGRMAVVTGANSGIGFELAQLLAKTGYHVVLACRNTKAGEEAIQKIKTNLGNNNLPLETLPLDLCSLASVAKFASLLEKRAQETGSKFDLLVNNAGVMFVPRFITGDGYEMQFQANYLSHFALSVRLVDVLARHGAPSRIVSVTSDTYEASPGFNFDDLAGQKSSHRFWAYTNSNLARTTMAKEMSRRLADKGIRNISVFAVHPGSVVTPITRNSGGFFAWAHGAIVGVFSRDALHGSLGPFHASVSSEFTNQTGLYLNKTHVHPMSKTALDPTNGAKLWDLSIKYAHLELEDNKKALRVTN
jgi:NAD(P)-dependent dehydrogenase (short-subunit alcohol dehydrogenase family)